MRKWGKTCISLILCVLLVFSVTAGITEEKSEAERLYELSEEALKNSDYEKYYEYARMAADLGGAGGLNNVGHCYLNGWGVEQDYEKALEYLQKSADLGW